MKYQLSGIGQSIVDLVYYVDDAVLLELNLVKNSTQKISKEIQYEFLRSLERFPYSVRYGGSIANTFRSFAKLGGDCHLSFAVGKDKFGELFVNELRQCGVGVNPIYVNSSHTGLSIVLITPDGHRTMCTTLGASLSCAEYNLKDLVPSSEWFLLEGYLLSDYSSNNFFEEILKYVTSIGAESGFTLSDVWVINSFRDRIFNLLPLVNLLICNYSEGAALTGKDKEPDVFQELLRLTENLILTLGERGSLIQFENTSHSINSYQCNPINLTGAGDVFLGAFMYSIISGRNFREAGEQGALLASKFISQESGFSNFNAC